MSDKSPHWPGVGRYIGEIKDYKNDYGTGLIGDEKVIFNFASLNETPYQIRRVYQDELDYYNKGNK